MAARWRVLTASAARSGTLNTADIVNGIMEFLVISGISFQQPSFQKVEGAVQSSVETVLREVVKLKADFELRVTSSDLEAHYVRSPSCFDAKTMIDTDAGGRGARKGRKEEAVLCTVGLGLRKVVWKEEGSGGAGGKQGTKRFIPCRELLMAPEVALNSILDEIMEAKMQNFDSISQEALKDRAKRYGFDDLLD